MLNIDGQLTLGDTLVEILTAQRNLYQKLADLAHQQSQYVANGQSEQLMTILAARARLIEQLAPLDQKLQSCKGHWQEILDRLAPGARITVSGLLGEVQRLLAGILAQDEADKESLSRQKTDIGHQISRTVTGAQLNRAYGPKRSTHGLGMGIG